jgi:hypothetical protein
MAQKFIGVTLPIRLGQTGMFDQSTTVIQQVRSNFKNLILTILFEPMTEDTLEEARLAVADAVDRWLPFIELTNFQITQTVDENIINILCTYRFRNNRNVTDQVSILTNALGAASVVFPQEPVVQDETARVNEQIRNARRVRRIN